MTPKPQVWKIARIVAGVAIAAGLLYFLYSKKAPPIVSWLIIVAVVFFLRVKRMAGVYDQSPIFRRMAMGSSSSPLRDFGLAVACLVAMIVVMLVIFTGIDHSVLPDNKMTEGILWVVIIAGIAGAMWFMSGIITRVVYGPPPSRP